MEEVITGVSGVSRHVDSSSHVQVDLHLPAPRVSGSACLPPGDVPEFAGRCYAIPQVSVGVCGALGIRVPSQSIFTADDGPELPTRANEEFRPFIRRLPEFKFWYSVTKSTVIAVICTFFDCFNIPVFWPILVMYFITLTCITMKRQIKHMIKYRYLPFTHGKPKYQGHEDTGKVISPK
uniref:Protein RER1 n=1 Tax=Timema tahoe TaxID=61484 RepID=A0A7R9IBU1_9NEOP|nr:unnamed protein product [Timema tahoe]